MSASRGRALGVAGLAAIVSVVALMYAGAPHVDELAPHDTMLPAAEAEPAAPPPPATFEECVRRAIDAYANSYLGWEGPAIREGFIMHAEIILCERQFPAEAGP